MCCGGWSRELLLRELKRPLRVRRGRSSSSPRCTAMSAIGRWSCGTSSPYWIEMSCAVAACVGCERPAARPELDPREPPERAGSSRLVAFVPLAVLALEERPRRVRWEDGASVFAIANVASCTSRWPPTAGAKLRRPASRDPRCRAPPREPAEDRLHDPRARAEDVVVELLGELERGARVVEPPVEARRPRKATVDVRLKRRARRRLAERLFEQATARVDALELGEQDEPLGARSGRVGLGEQLGCDRRARVHSPAAW